MDIDIQQLQDDFDEFVTELDWMMEDLQGLLRDSRNYRDVTVNFEDGTLDRVEAFYLDVLSGKETVTASQRRMDRIFIAYVGEAVRERAGGQWHLNDAEGDDAYGTPVIIGWTKGDHVSLSPVHLREAFKQDRKPFLRELVDYCANKDQFEADFFKEFE